MDQERFEDIEPGRRIKRSPDGRFEKVELDSELAAAMGRARKRGKAIDASAESLLIQAGFVDPSQAPEHLILLARLGASQRSGAVQALAAFLRLTSQADSAGEVARPQPGEKCSLCRQYVSPFAFENNQVIERLVEIFEELRGEADLARD